MGGWLTTYFKNILKLHDEVLVEYYTGILEDPDLSNEEKLAVLRESLSESGSPVLTSQDKIEEALNEILCNYQNPSQQEEGNIGGFENENLDSNYTNSSNLASVEFISLLNPKAKEFKPSFLVANDNPVSDGFTREEENNDNDIPNTFVENYENSMSGDNEDYELSGSLYDDEDEEESDLYLNMSPTELLHQIFTDVEPDHLIKIFEQSSFDLECTLNELLNIGNTTVSAVVTKSSSSSTTLTKEKGKQMCRFFLEGTCFRKDCMFSHDLQNVICKFCDEMNKCQEGLTMHNFRMRGSCLAGDNCIFIHEIDLNRVRNALDASYNNYIDGQVNHTIPDALDKSAFPDLLSSSTVQITKKTASSFSSPSQFANVVKRRRLSEQFPWIDSNIINSHLAAHENKIDATAAILEKKYPRPTNFVLTKAIPARLPSLSKRRRAALVIKPPEHIPWLVTGSALSAEYKKYRSQALACGRKRNAASLYERAASSYKSNRGDLAKKYSLQAQEYNLRMRELNREAARKIFDSRNNAYCKEPFIDLHGLHVDEAIEFLDASIYTIIESFEALELENYKGSIYIVTGTGHHSQNRKAKLGPAIKDTAV
ncbi:6457_t:CDS:2 [Ambispora leptoticha]|uniref:6457_t:CDS:1 n=1 Tax=Ambispora leptoticha TaxID=144679 RepID=A0A9N8VXI7_9GLOM|nr:6457_t:CDS:2 [Ambispora leptoticha]